MTHTLPRRPIQEWAHPITVVNYVLLGLSSGTILASALAIAAGDVTFAKAVVPWALATTALAWISRAISLRRNANLRPKSSTQSATGINSGLVVQKSMGMTGGSFNTREFFHGASPKFVKFAKTGFQVLTFVVPMVLLSTTLSFGWFTACLVAVPLQLCGLLIERWFFFAQAQHPQNLYYQAVS